MCIVKVGEEMKNDKKILQYVAVITLLFTVCNAKHIQEETNTTQTDVAHLIRSVEVINVTPTLSSLSLESNVTTVNVGETVQLSVTGTYSDNSTKTVDENVTYIVTPADYAKVNGSVLTALKDGNVTVQAKVGNTLSNVLHLNITWIVNGHVLPPEPDPAINNSTLLGIDSNSNGVRDDMERYIVKTYGKEEITIQIGFQVSRAYDTVIEHPENAWETYKVLDAALDCESYFRNYANMFGDPILIKNRLSNSKLFKSLQLNTKERIRGYLLHDKKLSGGVFDLTEISKLKSKCSFHVDTLLRARK
jgi:hypothetical protein